MIYQLSRVYNSNFFPLASHQPALINIWYQSGLPASSHLYHPSRLCSNLSPWRVHSNPYQIEHSKTRYPKQSFFMLIRKRETACPLSVKGDETT